MRQNCENKNLSQSGIGTGRVKFWRKNVSVGLKQNVPGFARMAQFSSLYISYIIKYLYNDSKIRRSKEKAIQLFFRTHEKCKQKAAQENDFASLQLQEGITNKQ